MGARQSRETQPDQYYYTQNQNHNDRNGPYFGGYGPGAFSIRNREPIDKPLPEPPQIKNVRFGTSNPPAWEFYRNQPTYDNTANTRYASPPNIQIQSVQSTPPPAYRYNSRGELVIQNQ